MEQSNQSDVIDNNGTAQNQEAKSVVDLSKHQEDKQTSESSAFEQVMMQMNIADRKSFDKKYNQLWNEASDDNQLLSLMICEIDFFKAYHDNYGHQGASFMLLVIALALKTTCEEYDCYLGRYKGDKFGILMKGGTVESAQEVADKLRLAVEKSRTEHKHSTVSNIVTLSIGLSSFYPTSMQAVMQQAGGALTDAKSSGRNQVVGHLEHEKNTSPTVNTNTAVNQPLENTVGAEIAVKNESSSEFLDDVLQQEEAFRQEELRKEQELRKEEALRKEEDEKRKQALELKRLQEEEEEERKAEEKKKQSHGMFDMDFF